MDRFLFASNPNKIGASQPLEGYVIDTPTDTWWRLEVKVINSGKNQEFHFYIEKTKLQSQEFLMEKEARRMRHWFEAWLQSISIFNPTIIIHEPGGDQAGI